MCLKEVNYSPSVTVSNVPPWILPDAFVDLQLLEEKENWSITDNINQIVKEHIQKQFYSFVTVYTDGSKNPENGHVGVGIYIPEFNVNIHHRLTLNYPYFSNFWASVDCAGIAIENSHLFRFSSSSQRFDKQSEKI